MQWWQILKLYYGLLGDDMYKYNWDAVQVLINKSKKDTISGLARELNIPRKTLDNAIKRGDVMLNNSDVKTNNSMMTIKHRSTELVAINDIIKLYGVDMNSYTISNTKINHGFYVSGLKYYEITLTFIPKIFEVSRVVLSASPINAPDFAVKNGRRKNPILFMTDLHVGYVGNEQIHNVQFISNLMLLAYMIQPSEIVIGGDSLDLPDWSTFVGSPDENNRTQRSLNELAAILYQFRKYTNRLTILEGNHDQRIERMIKKNLSMAFGLSQVGSDLSALSLPHLLNLESLDIDWVGDYPNGRYKTGNNVFMHGNKARAISGQTASSIAGENHDTNVFYGHIHNMELVNQKGFYVGCPGCACNAGIAPGSKPDDNWQLGAFLISDQVELITQNDEGDMLFSGEKLKAELYNNWLMPNINELLDSLTN